MKIALLASVGRTIDAFFPEIIEQLTELGHAVVCAASTPSQIQSHTTLPSLSRRPRLSNLWASRDIEHWLRATAADVLITNTAVASYLARVKSRPCPVVYFCHGLHWDRGHSPSERVWQVLERSVLSNTDGVVVINADDQAWFLENAPCVPSVRLPSGVGLDCLKYPRAPLPDNENGFGLIWAGDFVDRKRPVQALEVLGAARREGLPAKLTMCGDGPLLADTQKAAETLGLSQAVRFAGRQPDIHRWLTESHALLMTSRWEGLPRVGLEAFAVGRTVFAFDVKGVRDLPNAILARDADSSALGSLIARHLPDAPPVRPINATIEASWVAHELAKFTANVLGSRALQNSRGAIL